MPTYLMNSKTMGSDAITEFPSLAPAASSNSLIKSDEVVAISRKLSSPEYDAWTL
jgi:hypothetical protein